MKTKLIQITSAAILLIGSIAPIATAEAAAPKKCCCCESKSCACDGCCDGSKKCACEGCKGKCAK